MVCIVGIDPGIRGGVSLLIGYQEEIKMATVNIIPLARLEVKKGHYRDRVDEFGLASLIKEWDKSFHIDAVYIEKQIPVSGQGLQSTSVTMEGFGLCKGVCAGLGIPHAVVGAKEWQSFYKKGDNNKETDTKKLSVIWAKKLFPEASLLRNNRSRTDSDGLSDALLIGYYGVCSWEN